MPSPVPRGSRPPAPPGAGDETSELQRRPAGPGRPRAPGRLESSFSVEAILARPARRAPPANAPMSGVAADLGSAPSRFPATWLPAYLSVSLYQPCPQLPRTGLRVAHLYGLQGLGVTGTSCSGAWEPGGRPKRGSRDSGHRIETSLSFENHARSVGRGPMTLHLALNPKPKRGTGREQTTARGFPRTHAAEVGGGVCERAGAEQKVRGRSEGASEDWDKASPGAAERPFWRISLSLLPQPL